MRRRYLKAALLGAGAMLALPATALAQDGPTLEDTVSSLNTTWVIVAAVLVMFMQAGFAFLEIGFSRM
jgi:Amt family ammonium transporter